MKQGIPEQIKLFKFASRSLIFSQTYQVKDLPRIRDLVSNQDSSVDVKLSFNLEYGRIPIRYASIIMHWRHRDNY
jgi:uncharacterized protein